MNSSEYQKLYELETSYWWHVGRRTIVAVLIRKFALPLGGPRKPPATVKILDIGCGTGETTKFLSQFGKVTGLDAAEQAVEFCKRRGLFNIKHGCAECLPFKENSFGLVTMLDLLEHVENDSQALEESYRVLSSNGTLLITVPAHPTLWSEHDIALQHQRRYLKKELRAKVERAGFKVQKLSFAVTTLFLPMLVYRRLQRILPPNRKPQTSYVLLPTWLNNTLIALLKLEAGALEYSNLPFGASLVCLAKK